ncbi:hypothetical protein MD535_25440 [Vibrio sp. ZSDZ65]|uniref:Secreted protein n=1 Tax=Vibrio qingdaonensis TaxID=2829491 RepID=A0A9X3CTT2_9VIBR|nr:hypothetical protein [Vibrio qingdaonensis]MCW8349323.1 hypothetical protein [Vibrio qingdaonensis]
MKYTPLIHLTVLAIISPLALAGGTLGGSPSADSGAVNTHTGKCVAYAQAVKHAKQKGEDPTDIPLPKGCQAE